MSLPTNPTHAPGSASNAPLTMELLVTELLHERKRDRKAGIIKAAMLPVTIIGSLVAYALIWFFLMGSFNPDDKSPTKPFVAVVPIEGTIGAGSGASYDSIAPLLRQAFEHPKSLGVVLSINSPGGTPVQSALIHDLVLELKQQHGKKVIAVGADMMTSGAYFIAASADTILANRSTLTGSIGVISSGFGFTGLMDKLGVERRVTTAGESKSMLDPFRPVSPQESVKMRELLDDIHGHFKDAVVQGRGSRLNLETKGLFEGTVWTGAAAMGVGLVDALGNVQTAAKAYLGTDDTVIIARKKTVPEMLLDMVGVKVAASLDAKSMNVPQAVFE